MVAVTSVQSNVVSPSGVATTMTITLTSGIIQGNLVVACVACGNNADTITPPDASWQQAVINQPSGSSATIEAAVFYLLVDGSHAGQTSWTFSFSASHTNYITIREWNSSTGWQARPVDQTAQGDTGTPAAGTTVQSGTTAATSAAVELAVAAMAYKLTSSAGLTESGYTSGWTVGNESTLSNNNTLREMYVVTSATGAQGCSFTISGSQFFAGSIATFMPAAGSSSVSGSDGASGDVASPVEIGVNDAVGMP